MDRTISARVAGTIGCSFRTRRIRNSAEGCRLATRVGGQQYLRPGGSPARAPVTAHRPMAGHDQDRRAPKRLVAAAAARERSISALLNHDQRRLIHKCAGIVVNPVALTMLPAMSAMRWPPPPFTVPGPGASALEVRAERWDCQRLGLPRVVDCRRGAGRAGGPGGADRLREGKGLQPSAGEAKTIQVLQRLVTEAAC
jgi:hypothetical protein